MEWWPRAVSITATPRIGERIMRDNRLQVSFDTLIAASLLLGHELEDRSSISASQDAELTRRLAHRSGRPLRSFRQRDLFCVAPLDILVS